MGNKLSEGFMKFKSRKVTKPAQVPRIGWTLFIAVVALQGFIGIFDPVLSKTVTDKIASGAVGIGFSLWTFARVSQMNKFEYKLRKKPSLAFTIFLGIAGLISFSDLFSSTVTASNNQTIADKLLGFFVGIYFLLWAILRYIFGREFEKKDN